MICPNCKVTVAEGTAFCPSCGAKIAEAEIQKMNPQETNAGAPQPTDVQPTSNGGEKKGGKAGKIIAALAAVAVVAVIVIAVILTSRTTVDLNDYITVSILGDYDTLGSASYSFDEEQFILDYADKIKLTGDGETAYGAYVGSYIYPNAATLLAYEFLEGKGELSQSSSLSNGDNVTFSWDISEEAIEKYFKIKLEADEITKTVSGLDEIEQVDVFECVEVVFQGVSPDGTAYISVTGEDYRSSSYSLSESSGLSNGDEITVTFSESEASSMQYSGKTPKEMSKTYTVELPTYIVSLDEVAEEILDACGEKAESLFEEERSSWDSKVKFISMNYVTDYLMTKKANGNGNYNTILYLVYEIEIEQDGMALNYFWYTGFYDIAVNADGSYLIDLSSYTIPEADVWFASGATAELYSFSEENGLVQLLYSGYEKMSELYENLITGNEECDYEGQAYTEEDDEAFKSAEVNILSSASEYNGHHYAFISGGISWQRAEALCEALGGHLVTITSSGEQNYIGTLVGDNATWIGGYLEDNSWCWVTGENWSYENWNEGEPSGGDENCASRYGGDEGKWNDLTDESGETAGFVCEWD